MDMKDVCIFQRWFRIWHGKKVNQIQSFKKYETNTNIVHVFVKKLAVRTMQPIYIQPNLFFLCRQAPIVAICDKEIYILCISIIFCERVCGWGRIRDSDNFRKMCIALQCVL